MSNSMRVFSAQFFGFYLGYEYSLRVVRQNNSFELA